MQFKLTITPMQSDFPEFNCLFTIESECGTFHLCNYMNGTNKNRMLWVKMVESLNQ